ncbi:hypothetical protein OS493_033202 [Desmophyllum pertusum]|uniref:CCHC-type domain-containing protein n=1 Tax=Desmophyllum pertusum TaxID=174260 RepID=A0A9W9Y839_9CNID|nr:hypothetical protein OS493_033202 [Desmophyllum pertusum]
MADQVLHRPEIPVPVLVEAVDTPPPLMVLADQRERANEGQGQQDLPVAPMQAIEMVAKETNHPRAGFFDAAFRSMREKLAVSDVQFKKYLEVLLGDKDQEKVLDTLGSNRVPWRGRGHAFRPVQCYHCRPFGHYQSYCPDRRRAFGEAAGTPTKRGRFDSGQFKS